MKTKSFILSMVLICFSLFSFSQENVNMAMGNPSNAITSTSNPNNYLMVKNQYCLSYNNAKHIPNWVSWHVGISDLGHIRRQNNFRSDSTLPDTWYHVTPSDYYRSGFDRGHMCPSGDRTSSTQTNSMTFLMTNMVPQAPHNNRITLEHLESYCRKLVDRGNELYIIAGPYGHGGTGSHGDANEVGNGVVVPADVWKIIVVLPEGVDDVNRVTSKTRVIAVFIPNAQSCSQKDWGAYRVSVDKLQELTGYDFLSNVPKNIQKVIEAKVDIGGTN